MRADRKAKIRTRKRTENRPRYRVGEMIKGSIIVYPAFTREGTDEPPVMLNKAMKIARQAMRNFDRSFFRQDRNIGVVIQQKGKEQVFLPALLDTIGGRR